MQYLAAYFFNSPINNWFDQQKLRYQFLLGFFMRMKFEAKNNKEQQWARYCKYFEDSETNEPYNMDEPISIV